MRLRRGVHRWLRFWWKVSFRLEAEGSLSCFNFGKKLHFDAPVHVGYGKGTLKVAGSVWFGWDTAPRVGSGSILLEPRSPDSLISIGAGTAISNNVSIIAMGSIQIGQRCLIGEMVQIFDCDFHEIDPGRRKAGVGPVEAVSIGDNVWIGSRVIVLKGSTIGDNSVIAAGSVVTHSIPSNSLAAGVPARVIRALWKNLRANLIKGLEPVLIQALVLELAVETPDVTVLHGQSRRVNSGLWSVRTVLGYRHPYPFIDTVKSGEIKW